MKSSINPAQAVQTAKSPGLAELSDQSPMMVELYHKAEAQLRSQKKRKKRAESVELKSAGDPHRLLHELQVHQIELEMQNSELLEARNRTEVLLEKYTDLYDFAPVGYLSLDEHGHILEINLTGAALLGVRRSELTNRRLQSFITPSAQMNFLAFLKRVFAEPKNQGFEATLLRENGASFFGSFYGTCAVSANESPKSCRMVIKDITAHQQAVEALRVSDERFRTLFEVGPVAIYSCDSSGMIQQFNRRVVELWGREPKLGDGGDRFCGSFKLFRPSGALIPRPKSPMADVLSGKLAEIVDLEAIFERPDGSRITCIVNIRALKDPGGKITGAINCFYDITGRKQAEAMQRRLEVIAASNGKLENEIIRRRVVEKSLKESEQYKNEMLIQSRHMQQQLRSLSRQVLSAQEDERKRISRELHDIIAQTLTGVNVQLTALAKASVLNPKDFNRKIARTQRLVEKSVSTVHEFARELRPAVLDDLGLIPALHSFMKKFSAKTGIRAHLTAVAAVEKLEISRRTVLFRVAQEALTNVDRHANASQVEVNIRKISDGISMKIHDDGKSFSVDGMFEAKGGNRLGLLGMRERLEMIGGDFDIKSVAGKGTTVIAQIPL